MAKKSTSKSKVDTVIALAQRKSGCTLAQIVSKLNVSATAASSLIGDARRKGTRLKCKADGDGVSRYYA